MSTKSRVLALAVAIAASVALSACGQTTAGTAERAAYSGPERSQDRSTSASGFAPGIDITLGEGDSRAVCTAGWILESKGVAVMVTAGHCAVQGEGTPVTFGLVPDGGSVVTDRKETSVGEVGETSYAEPYNPDSKDIAAVPLGASIISGVPISPYVGAHIKVEPPQKDISGTVGNKVCWYSNASKLETIGAMSSCGTVYAISKDQRKILVTPDNLEKIDPQMAGAPAVISNGEIGSKERLYALGVFTDVYKDHVVIDNVFPLVDASGGTIMGTESK